MSVPNMPNKFWTPSLILLEVLELRNSEAEHVGILDWPGRLLDSPIFQTASTWGLTSFEILGISVKESRLRT